MAEGGRNINHLVPLIAIFGHGESAERKHGMTAVRAFKSSYHGSTNASMINGVYYELVSLLLVRLTLRRVQLRPAKTICSGISKREV